MAISVVSFSFSRAAPGGLGDQLSAECWLSIPHLLTHLISNSDFLSSPSYIIVQSPTQSWEWHVWASSSGNNCHAVHRSLSSGASIYACTMGFYPIPFCHPSPPTRFLLIIAIGMCHFLPVHRFGMACLAGSKVNIQQFVCISKSQGILCSHPPGRILGCTNSIYWYGLISVSGIIPSGSFSPPSHE